MSERQKAYWFAELEKAENELLAADANWRIKKIDYEMHLKMRDITKEAVEKMQAMEAKWANGDLPD